MRRLRSAVAFAVLTSAAQGLGLLAVASLAWVAGQLHPVLGAPLGLMALLGIPASVALAPAAIHEAVSRRSNGAIASLRATVLLAFCGFYLGSCLGSVFLESGDLRGFGVGSVIGGLLATAVSIFIGCLRHRSSPTLSEELRSIG